MPPVIITSILPMAAAELLPRQFGTPEMIIWLLPVKLSSFLVQKTDNAVKISWSTEQEINSSYFVVERSADGRNWNNIATVNAAGNSSIRMDYSIYDNAPMKGINYYRLKLVDKDGKYDYSVTRTVCFVQNIR